MARLNDIKLAAPKFGINETAYPRASALKGFIEEIRISGISFSRSDNTYIYQFLTQGHLSPIFLRQDELMTLCEAIPFQITYLTGQLARAEADLEKVIGTDTGAMPGAATPYTESGAAFTTITPDAPRFQINEAVYLIETSETTGHIEMMRPDALEFDSDLKQWKYTFVFKPKPGENMTVGDRNDLRNEVVIVYAESELGTIEEVLPLRVQYLTRALNAAITRRTTYCPDDTN